MDYKTYKLVYLVRGVYECWFIEATSLEEALEINHKENHRRAELLDGYEII